ncbi:MAG TPA: ATP-binding protein [Bacillota bacterium]|jgi:DNA replication protein DnaC|nr:ATP-binding protein [Fastidiosipila sp.]HPX93207.1 ATP-binding protein [Bacillota bacterium]HQB81093.1 ATP-binding protein [Bacillota bacterium]
MKSLTQRINDDVIRIYERRRNEAFKVRDERVEQLYARFPRLEELDRQLREAGLNQLLAVVGQERGPAGSGAEAFALLEKERLSFLKRHSIADGYDQPAYVCRACNDTGRADGDWCRCRRQIIQEILPAYFPDVMDESHTFASFNLNLFSNEKLKCGDTRVSAREQMADYLQMAQLYTGHFNRLRDRNLFFSGAPGTGKTFLMQCIGHRLMDEGKSVVYMTAPNLFDLITRHKRQKASYRPDPELLEETSLLFKALQTWELLLIDDLGTEPVTPDTYAQLILLLDARQHRKLATIIASNIEVADFSRLYDRRIASRLNGNFLKYAFIGDDLRLRKKHQIP